MPIRALLLVLLLAAGCTSAVRPSASADADGVAGGTLRVAVWVPDDFPDFNQALLDPQSFFWHPLFRCCLLRTLLSYSGQAIVEGGAQVQPDLAEALPEVSPDGLTWTFRIRGGVRYAPPFEEREIVARDFVTALERTVRRGESPYFDIVAGVAEYRDGAVGTIAGVQTPDESTLVFRLTEAAGDFEHRVALGYLAPIPAEALVAHDEDYAGYLVASGPYMLEGAETVDHADPDAPPSWEGSEPGELTLVRNPSWSRDIDRLRPAYADRIEVGPIADRADFVDAVADGEFDVMLDPLLATTRNGVAADPALRARLREAPLPTSFFIPLNVAQPPFDDLAVRRAVNLVIDRAALSATFDPERSSAFLPAGHAFPDVVEAGLLRDYAPFETPDGSGDPRRAREEMALSRYDTDGDGRCDGEACQIIANQFGSTTDSALEIIRANLAELGIEVSYVDEPFMADPAGHVAFAALFGWAADYPSASDFVGLVREPTAVDNLNYSLVGATPEQLAEWGYPTTDVPSLDEKTESCGVRSGSAGFACWAELDQLLTDQVVAWVPVATSVGAWLISDRVDRFDVAGNEAVPALDRISLRPEPAP